jgi:uncharacterized protein YjbI with pentapeptide repeats
MASKEHLQIIEQGVAAWNEWRNKNPELVPDLGEANLGRMYLCGAYLSGANLREAYLPEAKLWEANLSGADLSGAELHAAQFVRTDFRGADLSGSSVYGASVWDIEVDDQTKQQNLVITRGDQAVITVDNINVAQFIYLLLNNKEIGNVIDTIGRKGVLLLGRFTGGRMPSWNALSKSYASVTSCRWYSISISQR